MIAGAVLGVVGGLISVFVMMRDLPFAVHGISELSFAGAAGGAAARRERRRRRGSPARVLAAVVIGVLGARARDRNSIIGVLMPFGLGLGVLFLSLYQGRSANKFGLLTGQIVAVDTPQLCWLIGSAVVVSALLLMWRPLTLREPRSRGRRRPRGAGPAPLAGLHAAARAGGRRVGADRRRAARAEHRLHTGGRGDAGDGLARAAVALSVLFAIVAMVGGILLALGSYASRSART